MAIDKGLYQAPQGLANTPEASPLEIEIVDPEAVHIKHGNMEIDIEEAGDPEFSKNLAEDMSEQELMTLSSDLVGLFETDINGRKDWADTYVQGLKLLGLKYEETTEPWAGACGVFHPMLSEAVVRFQSEAIMETFPASGPVKTQIIGKETNAKKEASVRVAVCYSYRLARRCIFVKSKG